MPSRQLASSLLRESQVSEVRHSKGLLQPRSIVLNIKRPSNQDPFHKSYSNWISRYGIDSTTTRPAKSQLGFQPLVPVNFNSTTFIPLPQATSRKSGQLLSPLKSRSVLGGRGVQVE